MRGGDAFSMGFEGIEDEALVMPFIGEMQDSAAFEFVKIGDLLGEQIEDGLGKGTKFFGGQAKDLRRVIQTCNGGERVMQPVFFEWCTPCCGAAADVFEGHDGVGEAKGKKLKDGAAHAVVRGERGFVFQHVHHARPSWEREQFGGDQIIPVRLWDSESIQHFETNFIRSQAEPGLPFELAFHAVKVAWKESGSLAHDGARALEQSFLAIGHWPISDALIQVGSGKTDQGRVDNIIESDAVAFGNTFRGPPWEVAFRRIVSWKAICAGFPECLWRVGSQLRLDVGGEIRTKLLIEPALIEEPLDVEAIDSADPLNE